MKLSKEARCFLTSMLTTLCLIGLCAGLAAADYHTRWIGFGRKEPIVCIAAAESGRKELKIDTMGVQKSIDITPVWEFSEQVAGQAERFVRFILR